MGFLPRVQTTRQCGGHSRTDGKRCAGCVGAECYTRQRTRAIVEKYTRVLDQGNAILDGVKPEVKDDPVIADIIRRLKEIEQQMNELLGPVYDQAVEHNRRTGDGWQKSCEAVGIPVRLPSAHAIA